MQMKRNPLKFGLFSLATIYAVRAAIEIRGDAIYVSPGDNALTQAFEEMKRTTAPGKTQSIYLKPGTYNEVMATCTGNKGKLMIYGQGGQSGSHAHNQVLIQGSTSPLNKPLFINHCDNVEVHNIDFLNSYHHGTDSQAVALEASGNNQKYFDCSFTSYQDTLYDKQGNHYYQNCHITGAVDFICGGARSFFEAPLITILKNVNNGYQYITANRANNPNASDSIFVFNKAQFEDGTCPSQTSFFGRPWGLYPAVVFQYSGKLPSLNSNGWLDKGPTQAQSISGFREYPTVISKNGHPLNRNPYTLKDIYG